MKLIDASGLKPDRFAPVPDGARLPAGDVILPLARLAAEGESVLARGAKLGVHVSNTATLDELAPFLHRLALISIAFPSFSDGRGFSLARRLRLAGYRGILRATGPLIADQMRHAFGVGFDEVAMPDTLLARQPAAQWTAGLAAITQRYQRNGALGLSILDRRREARQAARWREVAHAA